MANRRMFAKSITQSSGFLRMPMTSRLLYYDLGMQADDDGFCEWYTVLQMTGATQQDLEVLQANRFVKVFDQDVLIIRDWKENNHIQKDRYTASRYLPKYENQLKAILVEADSYVSTLDTQVSIGKVSIGNIELNEKTAIKAESVAKKQPSCPLLKESALSQKYPKGHTECVDYLLSIEKERAIKFINRSKQFMFLHKILRAGYDFTDIDRVTPKIESKYGANAWDIATVVTWLEKGAK